MDCVTVSPKFQVVIPQKIRQMIGVTPGQKMPMVDSLILTTARTNHATLWTQDEHFQGMVEVIYIQK
jgi:hypothetical protein